MTNVAPAADPTTQPPVSLRLVLLILSFCAFAVNFNSLIIGPLLHDLAKDFGVAISAAGLVITAYALSAGVVALLAAPLLDRYGRVPIIIASLTTLAVATFASALAPNFWLLLLCRMIAGVGAAGLQPAVFATVGDYVPYGQRGRAMGWMMTAGTVAGMIGVPVGVLLAGSFSWRLVFVMLGVITSVATLVFVKRFPRDGPRPAMPSLSGYRAGYREVFSNRFARMLLLSNVLLWLSMFSWITYMGAFFIEELDLSTAKLGPVVAASSFGVLLGSNGGGRLADRIGKKPVIVTAGFLASCLIVIESNIIITAWFAGLLQFTYAIPIGARVSSATALATAVAPEKRGMLMAINSASQQFGIMGGAAVGGIALAIGGYGGLGIAVSAISIASTLIVMRFIDEEKAIVPQTTTASVRA